MSEPAPGTPGPGDRDAPAATGARDEAPGAHPFKALLHTAQWIARELPGLVSDRVELLTLEIKRAGIALAQIIALVIATAILGVTAWLVLWGGIVAFLIHVDVPLPWALGIVLVFNLVAIWLAVSRVRKLLPRLNLPATRRHLTLSPSPEPRTPAPEQDRPTDERHDLAAAGQPASI